MTVVGKVAECAFRYGSLCRNDQHDAHEFFTKHLDVQCRRIDRCLANDGAALVLADLRQVARAAVISAKAAGQWVGFLTWSWRLRR